MGDRNYIGIQNENNTIDYIYCHWGSHPKENGLWLRDNVKTTELARKLIDNGDTKRLTYEAQGGVRIPRQVVESGRAEFATAQSLSDLIALMQSDIDIEMLYVLHPLMSGDVAIKIYGNIRHYALVVDLIQDKNMLRIGNGYPETIEFRDLDACICWFEVSRPRWAAKYMNAEQISKLEHYKGEAA